MRVDARCRVCGREFFLVMLLPPEGTGGRCPFCGFDYEVPLAELGEVVAAVEKLADTFTHALRRLIELHPGFDLDVDATLRLVAPLAAEGAARRPHHETALVPLLERLPQGTHGRASG
jgi:hypothetical protein